MNASASEPCFACYADGAPLSGQTEAFQSFIGGRPALPPDQPLPHCGLCDAPQTFYFQVAFPLGHSWAGLSVAVFACTRCADFAHVIPPMLEGVALPGADIPSGFLEAPQENYRTLVFPTAAGRVRSEHTPIIAFQGIYLQSAQPEVAANKVGGEPTWLLDDEAPATYAGRTAMTFLLQLLPDTRFPVVPGAPAQMTVGLDGRPKPTGSPDYELFISNAVYLFGTRDVGRPLVYVLTQAE